MALSPPPSLIEAEIFLRWELCISKDAQHSLLLIVAQYAWVLGIHEEMPIRVTLCKDTKQGSFCTKTWETLLLITS